MKLARYHPGRPAIELAATHVAVFTDLHLSPMRPAEIQAFAASLTELPPRTEALVILGDLFDAYVGPEDLAVGEIPLLWQATSALREAGIPTYLIRGNRDVLMTAADGRRVGIEVVDSVIVRSPAGEHCLLTHGDAFCLGDRPYQRLRRILRQPLLRPILRGLPLGIRRRLAARLRRRSTLEVARKPLDMMALHRPLVATEASRHQAAQVILGHFHCESREVLEGGVGLWILPAWEPGRLPVDPLDSPA